MPVFLIEWCKKRLTTEIAKVTEVHRQCGTNVTLVHSIRFYFRCFEFVGCYESCPYRSFSTVIIFIEDCLEDH